MSEFYSITDREFRRTMANIERDWAKSCRRSMRLFLAVAIFALVLVAASLWLAFTQDSLVLGIVYSGLAGYNLWLAADSAKRARRSRKNFYEAIYKAERYEQAPTPEA